LFNDRLGFFIQNQYIIGVKSGSVADMTFTR